jgi:hypothetical protein
VVSSTRQHVCSSPKVRASERERALARDPVTAVAGMPPSELDGRGSRVWVTEVDGSQPIYLLHAPAMRHPKRPGRPAAANWRCPRRMRQTHAGNSYEGARGHSADPWASPPPARLRATEPSLHSPCRKERRQQPVPRSPRMHRRGVGRRGQPWHLRVGTVRECAQAHPAMRANPGG